MRQCWSGKIGSVKLRFSASSLALYTLKVLLIGLSYCSYPLALRFRKDDLLNDIFFI